MRYIEIQEAKIALGRAADTTGLTFGFEAEMICRAEAFADPVDLYDLDEDEFADMFGIDADVMAENFSEWKEDNDKEDATLIDWINDIGEKAWWRLNRADGNFQYSISDDEGIVSIPDYYEAASRFSDDMSYELGIDHVNHARDSETPLTHKSYDEWNIEPDPSVSGQSDLDHSFEVISPVFHSWTEFTNTMTRFFAFVTNRYQGDIYTNNTTGLHINIGAGDAEIDPLKLLLFSGERWMTNVWGREGNLHTQRLLPELGENGLPRSIADARQFVTQYIDEMNEKHYAINLKTLLSRGYVEFRPIGGADYEKKVDQVIQHINRFVQLLRIAADPNAYVQEYKKKLALLVGGPALTKDNADYATRQVIKWAEATLSPRDLGMIVADGGIICTPETLLSLASNMDRITIPPLIIRILVNATRLRDRWDELAAEPRRGYSLEAFERAAEHLAPYL